MEINKPEIVAQVRQAFERYERALVSNDVAVLIELFWDNEATVRYAPGQTLVSHKAIAAFRNARGPEDLARSLDNTIITTFGDWFATACTEYQRTGSGRRGRQSQTWVKFEEGWRIVAAHVGLD